ncbi:hypothetical protein RV11_GL002067 [Enterococcus phoeniculicola]|nr:hypothetical protein RV11_GL002067 [Enterococcus phoeniculicola]
MELFCHENQVGTVNQESFTFSDAQYLLGFSSISGVFLKLLFLKAFRS